MTENLFSKNTYKRKCENKTTQIFLCSSVFLFVLFCVVTPHYRISAQEAGTLGLGVSPQVFELDVFPGERIEKKIDLRNLSPVPMPILVKVTDFTAQENSGEMEFDESLQDPSIASRKWFEIKNPNFILEANEKEEVSFEILVPENAERGGHYSVILFEPQLPSFYFKPGQPRTIPVVGVLFLLSVKTFALEPEIEQKLEIVEFSLPKEERLTVLENLFRVVWRFVSRSLASINPTYAAQTSEITITEKSPSAFVLRIKNNDIYHLKPSGKVLIYNIFGKRVGEAGVPKMTILPGKTRQFPVEFSPKVPEKLRWLPASISDFLVQNFFVGKYQAKLELQPSTLFEAGRDPFSTLTFFSFPWKFWLTFVLIFGLLIFLTIKFRKRIMLALKTLFKKPVETRSL